VNGLISEFYDVGESSENEGMCWSSFRFNQFRMLIW
jgi:hypothetical protein